MKAPFRKSAAVLLTMLFLVAPTLWAGPPARAQSLVINLSPSGASPSQASGPVETSVTLQGSDFQPGLPVTVTFDGAKLATVPVSVTVKDDGRFTAAFLVPEAAFGEHTIKVTVGVSEFAITFNVQPKLSISPTSGPKGSQVTVKGTGFAPNLSVDIFISSDTTLDGGDSLVHTTSSNGVGSFTTTFNITQAGRVLARDGAGNVFQGADAPTFTLSGRLTLDQTGGVPNTLVTLRGSEFSGSSLSEAKFAGISILPPGGVSISGGKFEFAFKVPLGATPGKKLVQVKDSDGVQGEVTFEVSPRSLTLEPDRGPVGTVVRVTGSGFPRDTSLSLQFNTREVARATTDATGSFTTTFSVPEAGDALHVLANGTFLYRAAFTVPAPEVDLSPRTGPVGTVVTLQGTGFSALEDVFIYWDAQVVGNFLTQARTDAMGNFTAAVTIPPTTTTTHNLVVVVGKDQVIAPISVTRGAPAAPSGVPVVDALSSIKDVLVRVWSFDAREQRWLLYDPQFPKASDLTTLEAGKGYWVLVKDEATLTFGGKTYPTLTAGWNLIGWLGS